MTKLPGIISITHCLISDPAALDLANIPAMIRMGSLILEDHDFSEFEFLALPDRPPGWPTDHFRPIEEISKKECFDQNGPHIYQLRELKRPGVSLLAQLPADQIESFCQRWSMHRFYSPFQGWEHVAPEVALQICQEQAFKKLSAFLPHFQPLCQQAIAESKGVYFLYELHGPPNRGS